MFARAVVVAFSAVAVAFAVGAPSASAAEIGVKVGIGATDGCLTEDGRIDYRMDAIAEVETIGVEPPKTIRVAYQLTDPSTNWTIASRAVNLRLSANYYKQSKRFIADAGSTYTLRFKASYKAAGTRFKRSWKTKLSFPTIEDAEAKGYPYC